MLPKKADDESNDDDYFASMDPARNPWRRPGVLYELDPSILAPAAGDTAAADTVDLPLDEFLERALPSSLIERSVLGILEEMEATLAKPADSAGGWPPLKGEVEKEEKPREENPESC